MKFFHISDLHFGKSLHGYDLTQDQKKFIYDIAKLAKKEMPDAIVIAGDIYDRYVPSGTAMTLLEEFFLEIEKITNEKSIEILIIAGNHDAAQRLRYGSSFLEKHHIQIAVNPLQENSKMKKMVLKDVYGDVVFYMLPYTKPGMIRHLFEEEEIQTSQDAIEKIIEREEIDYSKRNVLISHQYYVAGNNEPIHCESESPCFVGGLDGVDIRVVEQFDYVALGHIHSPQNVGSENIRYCGTPFPYSVSEQGQEKSVTIVEIKEKNNINIRCEKLEPLHYVRSLRGTIQEIMDLQPEKVCHDYVSITLTNEEILDQPKQLLENYYDHILELIIENKRTENEWSEDTLITDAMSPLESFALFFEKKTGREMDEEEKKVILEIIDEIGER